MSEESKKGPNLEEILKRDAASIEEGPTDVRLHQDTMRAIRNLKSEKLPVKRRPLFVIAASAAAVILISATIGILLHRDTPDGEYMVHREEVTQTSLQSYRLALRDGEDALLALLNRDAESLLPESQPVFLGDSQ